MNCLTVYKCRTNIQQEGDVIRKVSTWDKLLIGILRRLSILDVFDSAAGRCDKLPLGNIELVISTCQYTGNVLLGLVQQNKRVAWHKVVRCTTLQPVDSQREHASYAGIILCGQRNLKLLLSADDSIGGESNSDSIAILSRCRCFVAETDSNASITTIN